MFECVRTHLYIYIYVDTNLYTTSIIDKASLDHDAYHAKTERTLRRLWGAWGTRFLGVPREPNMA